MQLNPLMQKVYDLLIETYSLTADERLVLSEIQPDIYNILISLEDAALRSYGTK